MLRLSVTAAPVGLCVLCALCGCWDDDPVPGGDVVGPFTGEVHRYVVDGFTFPRDNIEARLFAINIDNRIGADNQFGQISGTLTSQDTVTEHAADIIAAGVVASTVEIEADDLENDGSVGLHYFGADGAAATVVGGRFIAGAFRANPAATTSVPGAAVFHLPLFVDTDPSIVEMIGMQIDLEPDGAGGFVGQVNGGFPDAKAKAAAYAGILQLLRWNPGGHRVLRRVVDLDNDGIITMEEVAANSLFASLLAPDVMINDERALSAGFRIHLKPCPSGRCTAAPINTCFDRKLDGDESDVDCGGSCRPCAAPAICQSADDCQSRACDALQCRAPTCTDGVKDGFESDLDCGGACATKCQVGQRCVGSADCASGKCSAFLSEGVCLSPP